MSAATISTLRRSQSQWGSAPGCVSFMTIPGDVGSDRIVDAVAASELYSPPLIVVDFGTATVFDAVAKDGTYLGGAIFPGINVAAESLFHSTAQLRRVELVAPRTAIGQNTTHALQSGLVLGYASMVTGMVERFKQELGREAKVIGTGGLAGIIARGNRSIRRGQPRPDPGGVAADL